MYWIEFLISAVVIIFAGIRLTKYADKLSEHVSIGKIWIGIVLLGFVTSLPEAITSLVSVISLGANDMAIGNVLGSNNFNLMLIFVMDAVYRKGAVTNIISINKSHDISALFAILLSLVVIFEIWIGASNSLLHIGHLSAGCVLIAVLYFVGMMALVKIDRQKSSGVKKNDVDAGRKKCVIKASDRGGRIPYIWIIWINLIFSAVVVIISAMWLAKSGEIIAQRTGLGQTFVGSIFLAIVTSLPEMVVSLSALKLGSVDMAIGNIFGSNMTNIFVIFVCELFYSSGMILSSVAGTHVFTAILGIILVSIAVVGIKVKHKKTFLGFGWDSILMFVIFIFGTGLLYL